METLPHLPPDARWVERELNRVRSDGHDPRFREVESYASHGLTVTIYEGVDLYETPVFTAVVSGANDHEHIRERCRSDKLAMEKGERLANEISEERLASVREMEHAA